MAMPFSILSIRELPLLLSLWQCVASLNVGELVGAFSQQVPQQSEYYYFAYGSNMVPETMTDLRKIRPMDATAAVLPNYKLRFTIPGVQFVEPSAAVVEYVESPESVASFSEPSTSVHGVLYRLSKADFQRVSRTEVKYLVAPCRR